MPNTHSMACEAELKWSLEAVREASELCKRVRSGLDGGSTVSKEDCSPVTIADYGAQALISRRLQLACPGEALVGEEDARLLRRGDNAVLRERVVQAVQTLQAGFAAEDILNAIDHGSFAGGASHRFWTLDPIDGTKGFLRGDQYAVALALIEDGVPRLGVMGCPALPLNGHTGTLVWAVRGGGAWQVALDSPQETGQPIHVMQVQSLRELPVCESVERAHTRHAVAETISKRLGISAAPVRMDSQCKYVAVARGDAGLYLRLPAKRGYEEKIWDHAAGALILEEAGGRISDINACPLDFGQGRTLRNNRGIVASVPEFHNQILEVVQSALNPAGV